MKKHLDKYAKSMAYLKNVIIRNNRLSYSVLDGKNSIPEGKIVGMIRLRNEEPLLKDTLDHMSKFVDGIVIFDDASSDGSVGIAIEHPAVCKVIINNKWRESKREWEETANRALLYRLTNKMKPSWFFYADADERFEGRIRLFLEKECPDDVVAIKISLFDSYITKYDKRAYTPDLPLFDFRKKFGPERRDILMIWRGDQAVSFKKPDLREPQNITGKVITRFYCQHYGKSLSVEHWEETCDYYIANFPKYSEKWRARKGAAVHEVSDFGATLYSWEDVKKTDVRI